MARIKEPVSGFTHLGGMLAAIVGLVFLIIYAAKYGNVYHVVSFTLFGSFFILMYAASGFYHVLNLTEKPTVVLKKIDHIMIYFVIASGYTPVCLTVLRGGWGWSIFGLVWGLALARTLLNYLLD